MNSNLLYSNFLIDVNVQKLLFCCRMLKTCWDVLGTQRLVVVRYAFHGCWRMNHSTASLQPAMFLLAIVYFITLWMHTDDAMKPLKCIFVTFSGFGEPKILINSLDHFVLIPYVTAPLTLFIVVQSPTRVHIYLFINLFYLFILFYFLSSTTSLPHTYHIPKVFFLI